MRNIVYYPADILRVKTEEIKAVDKELNKDINDLIDSLIKSYGVGLAATQIGMKRRFFGIKNSETKEVRVYLNPKITRTFGEKTYSVVVDDKGKKEPFLEGCLSFPELWGTVKRFLKIEVSWDEIEGDELKNKKEILEGFDAITFQHERDHLDGILFVDHIKADGGKFYKQMKDEMIPWSVDKVIEQESGKVISKQR